MVDKTEVCAQGRSGKAVRRRKRAEQVRTGVAIAPVDFVVHGAAVGRGIREREGLLVGYDEDAKGGWEVAQYPEKGFSCLLPQYGAPPPKDFHSPGLV